MNLPETHNSDVIYFQKRGFIEMAFYLQCNQNKSIQFLNSFPLWLIEYWNTGLTGLINPSKVETGTGLINPSQVEFFCGH